MVAPASSSESLRSSRVFALAVLIGCGTIFGCGLGRKEGAVESRAAVRVGPDWSARQSFVYAAELNSHAKLPSGNAAFALTLVTDLELSALRSEGDSVRLVARLEAPSLKLGGGTDAEAQKVSAELAQPVVVSLRQGRVADAWFSPGLSGVAVSTWRTLLGALQCTEPGDARPSWSAEEYDSAGRYRARYERPGGAVLIRQKSEYLALLDGQGGKPAPEALRPRIQEAKARLTIAGGVLRSVEQKETVVTRFDEHASLSIETVLSLRLRDASARPLAAPLDERAFIAAGLHLPPDRPAPNPSESSSGAFDKLKTEGRDFAQVVALFEKDDPANIGKAPWATDDGEPDGGAPSPAAESVLRERTSAFATLTAFLRSDVATVPKALAKIRAGGPAAPTLVSALAAARTPTAQAALEDVIRDSKLPGKLRAHALVGIGRIPRPERSVAATIIGVLAEPKIQNQALLSLGSLSRRLRDAGRNEEADVLRPELAMKLAGAADADARAIALRAVSNSGDAALFDAVKPYLGETASIVERGAAAEALRHMQRPEVNAILAERLLAETSAEVSLSILRALRTRGASPELVTALAKTIASGPTPNVRQRAVELAATWSNDNPGLRTVLAEAAEKDPDPEVRRAAARAASAS
jgi:hypothetical protein